MRAYQVNFLKLFYLSVICFFCQGSTYAQLGPTEIQPDKNEFQVDQATYQEAIDKFNDAKRSLDSNGPISFYEKLNIKKEEITSPPKLTFQNFEEMNEELSFTSNFQDGYMIVVDDLNKQQYVLNLNQLALGYLVVDDKIYFYDWTKSFEENVIDLEQILKEKSIEKQSYRRLPYYLQQILNKTIFSESAVADNTPRPNAFSRQFALFINALIRALNPNGGQTSSPPQESTTGTASSFSQPLKAFPTLQSTPASSPAQRAHVGPKFTRAGVATKPKLIENAPPTTPSGAGSTSPNPLIRNSFRPGVIFGLKNDGDPATDTRDPSKRIFFKGLRGDFFTRKKAPGPTEFMEDSPTNPKITHNLIKGDTSLVESPDNPYARMDDTIAPRTRPVDEGTKMIGPFLPFSADRRMFNANGEVHIGGWGTMFNDKAHQRNYGHDGHTFIKITSENNPYGVPVGTFVSQHMGGIFVRQGGELKQVGQVKNTESQGYGTQAGGGVRYLHGNTRETVARMASGQEPAGGTQVAQGPQGGSSTPGGTPAASGSGGSSSPGTGGTVADTVPGQEPGAPVISDSPSPAGGSGTQTAGTTGSPETGGSVADATPGQDTGAPVISDSPSPAGGGGHTPSSTPATASTGSPSPASGGGGTPAASGGGSAGASGSGGTSGGGSAGGGSSGGGSSPTASTSSPASTPSS